MTYTSFWKHHETFLYSLSWFWLTHVRGGMGSLEDEIVGPESRIFVLEFLALVVGMT